MDTPRRRWAVEILVIVGSILAAFAIDAWWDDRQLREDERAALEQLYGEFESNLGRIEDARADHQRAEVAFRDMLRIVRDKGEPAGSYFVPDSVLFELGSWSTVDPAQAVLASLVSSGRILLLDDEALRADLTSWTMELEDVREEEVEDRRIVADQVLPLVSEYVPLVSMEHRLGAEEFPSPSAFEGDVSGLLNSLEFENVMHGRLVRKLNILGEYSTLLARHRSVIAKLRAAIDAAR